jgi:hypothetical protein
MAELLYAAKPAPGAGDGPGPAEGPSPNGGSGAKPEDVIDVEFEEKK